MDIPIITALIALGGVLVGGLLTGLVTGINNRLQHEREQRSDRAKANTELCVAFLESVEGEERHILDSSEQHGVLPGDRGYDEVQAKTRTMLTALELRCSAEVHKAGSDLVKALESWGFAMTGDYASYRSARARFVRAVQGNP